MTPEELANAEASIGQLTEQTLSAYWRAKIIINFVTQQGGLAGASAKSTNAYNALLAFVTFLENTPTPEGNYLSTLTQNTTSPQY